MAALLFIPVGTFNYWQAWLFMAVFVGSSTATTVYLAINDPKLLERRMNAGPTAEKEPTQKIITKVSELKHKFNILNNKEISAIKGYNTG